MIRAHSSISASTLKKSSVRLFFLREVHIRYLLVVSKKVKMQFSAPGATTVNLVTRWVQQRLFLSTLFLLYSSVNMFTANTWTRCRLVAYTNFQCFSSGVGIWDRELVHIETDIGTVAEVTGNQWAIISEISFFFFLWFFHFNTRLFACTFAEFLMVSFC